MWDLIVFTYKILWGIVMIGMPIVSVVMLFGYPLFYILIKLIKEKSLFGDYSDFGEMFGGFYAYISILIGFIFMVLFAYGGYKNFF